MNKGGVLAFAGSPRKGGNTETLLAAVMRGVERVGVPSETVRLSELSIAPCLGCGGCHKSGHCVINDDMQELYGKILAARIVIIASPIYFYGLSAQTKIFVDRIQALWSRKQLLAASHQWHIDPAKKGCLLSVAATKGEKIFIGAQLVARYAFDAMGFHPGGEFLVRGCDGRGAIDKMPDTLQEAEAFGYEICTSTPQQ